jgi:carbamoyl-phosphate synthase large subunit
MKPFTGTVAVTALNATDNPGPGLAVARALRQDPSFHGRIVGLAYDVLDPALYWPDLFDAAFLLPYPSRGRDAWMARIDHVRRTVGLDVLLPNLDSELPLLLGHEDDLKRRGIATYLPSKAAFDAREKANLHQLAGDGVHVPEGVAIASTAELAALPERLGWPLVVKSALYGAEVCWSLDHAAAAFHRLASKWGLPIVVQRHVSGEEVNVCAVGDGEGGLIGAVSMKKLLLTDKGKGWAGVATEDRALLDLTAAVVKKTGWRGPLEVEAIRDTTGKAWLIEVNPRFPAWADLTAGAGQNQPLAVVRLAAGLPQAPMTGFAAGTAFVRISYDHIVHISDLESLTITGERLETETRRTA